MAETKKGEHYDHLTADQRRTAIEFEREGLDFPEEHETYINYLKECKVPEHALPKFGKHQFQPA